MNREWPFGIFVLGFFAGIAVGLIIAVGSL
jgi:hypothetical protein